MLKRRLAAITITDGPNPVGPDDWTTACMTATLDGGAVFIDDEPYNPTHDPDNYAYDSYFTSPMGFPNTVLPVIVNGGGIPTEESQLREWEWFDTDDTGNGDFIISRLSVQGDGDPATLQVIGAVSAANTGGTLFPYEFEVAVPEPGGLLLLGIGVLGLICRR